MSNTVVIPKKLKAKAKKDAVHRKKTLSIMVSSTVYGTEADLDQIAAILRQQFGYVEECRAAGLKDPFWKDARDGITLTFNGPKALPAKKNIIHTGGVSGGANGGVNDGVNRLIKDQINDVVTDGVNDVVIIEITQVVQIIIENEGLRALDIAAKRGKPQRTIERYLHVAKDLGAIEFRGAPKIGGYFLTKTLKDLIKR